MNKIVGFLKFSDYDFEIGEPTHFQQLIEGNIFFQKISFFENNGTQAQKDIEVSTDFNKFIANEARTEVELYERYGLVKYTIPSIVALKYISGITVKKVHLSINSNIKMVLKEKNKNYINDVVKNSDYDVIVYPDEFILKSDNIYERYVENGRVKFKILKDYGFANSKITFLGNDNHATWRIASFIQVTDENVEINGKLKIDFLNKILDISSPKGSIAVNESGELRPWVYIPKEILFRKQNYIEKMGGGSVCYYTKNKYPFSINSFTANPNCLLLAKDVNYKNQFEFRLITGGPNETFKNEFSPLLNLGWRKSEIGYGTKIEELQNLNMSLI
ncbi:hypothetical protein [Pediococcus pentosaceus]|uniref:hypothetical protein n=1 Tax=Pediococcus pentosaceus TaxID=1255 RepID=UPI001F5ADB91|nr:hypothetical protein [Pediococcus pentosaceus]MCI2960523.1 hypothetical protein [Pediococcus pentosaceus]